MNRAPGYYNVGLVQVNNVGKFYYMSTRNNAFSNREQKNTLIVLEDGTTIGGSIGIAIAALGLMGALGAYGYRYAKKNPNSRLAVLYRAVGTKDVHDDDSEFGDLDEKAPTILDKYPFLAGVYEYYAWNQPQIMFIIFFVCCQLGSFMFGVFINLKSSNPAPYFPYAKGFGKMLDFNMSFILLPILRNFLSYLRTTAAAEKLPLDDNIKIHKWTAYLSAFAATGHITMHVLDFVFMQNFYAVPLYESFFYNVPGPTGLIVTGLMCIMFSAAFLKRKIYNIAGRRFDGYRTFLMLHRLYIPVYALLWLHGSQFWQFSVFPLLFLFLEKFIQSRRTKMDVHVVDAKMVGKDVLGLKMQLVTRGKGRFRYKAGQYLYLCCPEVSETEYHPFTITSAPEENFFSCHIRCRKDMDWTYKLRETLGFGDVKRDQPQAFLVNKTKDENGNDAVAETASDSPLLRVDGPYGSASEEVFDYETGMILLISSRSRRSWNWCHSFYINHEIFCHENSVWTKGRYAYNLLLLDVQRSGRI
jgi:FAD-binding domain/Ferric reductase like transmembrane component